MTESRKTRIDPPRFFSVARLGLGCYKCCILAFFCLLSSILYPLAASAEGISVNKAEMRQNEEGYQLSVSYAVNPTLAAQQALSRGIPLYFVGEFSLTRSRWYWLDEEVFQGEQTIKLSFNVLTRQYRISRGALFQNFASFEDALNILARQSSATIPAELLKKDGSYTAAVRLRLDIAQLPKLLQVNALANKDWTLNTDWYRWVVRPAEITMRDESKAE
jgi:hypothetical protein